MAYNANIPQATDQLSQSQADLLNNFQDINTGFNLNHVQFNSGASTGMHKFLQMPVQGAAPAPVAGQIDLYNLNYAGTGNNELFIQPQTGAAIPMTASDPSASGWTYLPSGILMFWGFAHINAIGAGTIVTFAAGGFTSNCFSVTATNNLPGFGSRTFVQISTVTNTNFRCRISDSSGGAIAGDIYYIAIGN